MRRKSHVKIRLETKVARTKRHGARKIPISMSLVLDHPHCEHRNVTDSTWRFYSARTNTVHNVWKMSFPSWRPFHLLKECTSCCQFEISRLHFAHIMREAEWKVSASSAISANKRSLPCTVRPFKVQFTTQILQNTPHCKCIN
jgi:hypothetical protein